VLVLAAIHPTRNGGGPTRQIVLPRSRAPASAVYEQERQPERPRCGSVPRSLRLSSQLRPHQGAVTLVSVKSYRRKNREAMFEVGIIPLSALGGIVFFIPIYLN
jgi:hypothetical protein